MTQQEGETAKEQSEEMQTEEAAGAEASAETELEVVTPSKEEMISSLEQELAQAQAKADEYLDGWQRARAEFANYKKRVERDQVLSSQNATANAVKRYLEILDDLERALRNRPQEGEGAQWSNGVELIYRKFMNMIEAEGVKVMDVSGQFFDPNMHEAISQEDSTDHESGQIIGVVQQGYLLGDRVLRPARVRVAR
jgi:molecular chaperone GrpE